MKNIILGCVSAFILTTVFAFSSVNYQLKKSTAEVEQYQGVYVFSDSKPTSEYEYLGTVKRNTGGFGSSQYADVRDGLIKKAKKKYPNGNGVILILKSGASDRADVIRIN